MIGASLLLWALAADGGIARWEGLLLAALVALYTLVLVRQSRRETAAVRARPATESAEARATPGAGWREHWSVQLLLVAAGLALLVLGARWLVEAAVTFARLLGVSEVVIGLTIVAAGTSLPEVATSILAALRGERDIAVGNVVGSNIFNILAVTGISAAVAPAALTVAPALLHFDLPVMVAVAIACLPVFFSGSRIARWEGILFVGLYAAYTSYLILHAAGHPALDNYRAALGLALPLIAVTLLVLAARHWQRGRYDTPA